MDAVAQIDLAKAVCKCLGKVAVFLGLHKHSHNFTFVSLDHSRPEHFVLFVPPLNRLLAAQILFTDAHK